MSDNTARKLDAVAAPAEYFWFVARGSVLKGPYSSSELVTLLKRKEIRFEDFCWRQGFREWRPITCVPDFDRRGAEKSVTYPSVELPYGGAELLPFPGGRATMGRVPVERRMRDRRAEARAQVALAKTRRRTLTIYEWALAVIGAIVLAYAASYVALTEVSEKLTARMEVMRLGVPVAIGALDKAPPAAAWDPVYSSPGFKKFMEESRNTAAEQVTRYLLPAEITVPMPATAQDAEVRAGAHTLKANAEIPTWIPAKDSVDPVYIRPTQFRGHLSGMDAGTLWLEMRGEPLVPQGTISQGSVSYGNP